MKGVNRERGGGEREGGGGRMSVKIFSPPSLMIYTVS